MYTTKSQANIQLLKSIKDDIEYLFPTSSTTQDALHEMAKPVALRMTAITTSYTNRFSSSADFKTTFFLGTINFLNFNDATNSKHFYIINMHLSDAFFILHMTLLILRVFILSPFFLLMITIMKLTVVTLKLGHDRMSFNGLKSLHCFAFQKPIPLPRLILLLDACLPIQFLLMNYHQFDSACNSIPV